MATRKQRRRREKGRRHEWEEVWVDADGRELSAEEVAELDAAQEAARAETRPDRKPAPAKQQESGRREKKKIEPASWRRVLRRGAWFAPLVFLVLLLLGRGDSTGARVVSAFYTSVVMMAVFLPFSYLMDSLVYRSYRKRMAKAGKPVDEPSRPAPRPRKR
jgi:hypothetical protein